MPIKQTRYVSIASAVIGASSVPMRKLTGRIFSQHAKIPADDVLELSSAQIDQFLEANSPEANFARQYFSYTSPAPVNKPRALQVAPYNPTGRAPTLSGGDAASLDALKAIASGTLKLTIGNISKVLTAIDLSSVMAYADVASAIQKKLNAESEPAFASARVSFMASGSTFEINGGVPEQASISVESSALADAMGLSLGQSLPGSAAQTPLEAFIAAENISDSFGSATFIDPLTCDQAVVLAQYVAGENVKYQLHLHVSAADAEAFSAALIGTASTALNLKTEDNFYAQALPMAVLAATDYDRTNATTNYMFRQFGVTFPSQVTTDLDADKLDKLRVNYYGETAVAGSHIAFYQRGFLCGPDTAPLDMSVHANEQWLKAWIAQQWLSLLLATRGVPANRDGEARAMMVLAGAVTKAVDNGTILPGKTLSDAQKLAVVDASGDDLAWHDIQDKGYWYNVQIVENTGPSGSPEYMMKYVLLYGKGDWVRKIEGSHNLV
ncbi:Protein of unknown function [Izhakiella capsodis]|uniref:DUF3383 domain-containing protein n=1 Tax=Izhakiella capsodis TaxID=1367852 RepID=A0A1I4X3H4_9GAMM|nr:DUF3383 domain-containing protein [Izhakiella capsodis]SFN20023.1 Protein of unknown function [Izhakiella capsodis]